MAGMAIDLLMILLLGATAFWCVRVHRRLVALRAGQGEISAFVEALAAATARAEQAVRDLRAAATETVAAQDVQESALKARRDELARILDGAQRMNRRLEDALGQGARLVAELKTRQDAQAARAVLPEPAADAVGPSAEPPVPGARPGSGEGRPRRRVAEDLLEALQKLR
jgi:ABC-type transporter Mla subunit MlaD